MIKFKRGLRYDLSERTWELMSNKAKSEFTENGFIEDYIKEIPLSASNLPKHDIEIIDISNIEKKEIEEVDLISEPKEVIIPKVRKPRKKKTNESPA